MTPLLLLALKMSVPLAMALIVELLLRGRSAALRHAVLAAGIAGAGLVPIVQPLAPSWSTAMQAPEAVAPIAGVPAVPGTRVVAPASDGGQEAVRVVAPAPSPIPWTSVGLVVWGVGAACGLLVMAAGLWRLRRIHACATTVVAPQWAEAAADIAGRFGLTQPIALRESDQPLLVVFGSRRPTVLLPPSASAWSEQRIRIVLAHELAHVQRGDWLMQLSAEALRAVSWFNPLAWVAARRLRDRSELACDDLVLACGIDAADYASTLASLARSLRPETHRLLPAPAMARPSSLQRRVMAMLDTTVDRRAPKRRIRLIPFVALIFVAVVAAGYGATAQTFSTIRGQVQDPHGGTIGGVTVALTNQTGGQSYQVKTDTSGRYEIVGVVSGEYQIQFTRAGFRTAQQSLPVSARTITQNASLLVGKLEETISVAGGTPEPDASEVQMLSQFYRDGLAKYQAQAEACVPSAAGGALHAPTKLRDVRPLYPPAGVAAAETIEYDAVIATDGSVREAKLATPDATPELVSSGEAAIRQWRFTPTLLNCVPVEVEMRVHVRFNGQ